MPAAKTVMWARPLKRSITRTGLRKSRSIAAKLPAGQYRQVGFESRQVFDIDISRLVTEYRAQILEDEKGHRFVAPFPKGVTKAAQYGVQVKAHFGLSVTVSVDSL